MSLWYYELVLIFRLFAVIIDVDGYFAMEIQQLRYFVKACQTKNFSIAAEKCFISSQGLTMSITRLEKELGVQLFLRTRRGIEMTPEAEQLYSKALDVIAAVDDCASLFSKRSSNEILVQVMFSLGTIEEFALPCINSFGEKYPGMKLEVIEACDLPCENAVFLEEVELAVVVGPVDTTKFDAIRLISLNYSVVCGNDHPLANSEQVFISDLIDTPLVVGDKSSRTYFFLEDLCRKNGFSPQVDFFVTNPVMLYYLPSTTNMVGVAAYNLSKKQRFEGIRVIPFAPGEMEWSIYVISKKGHKLSNEALLFRNELVAHIHNI